MGAPRPRTQDRAGHPRSMLAPRLLRRSPTGATSRRVARDAPRRRSLRRGELRAFEQLVDSVALRVVERQQRRTNRSADETDAIHRRLHSGDAEIADDLRADRRQRGSAPPSPRRRRRHASNRTRRATARPQTTRPREYRRERRSPSRDETSDRCRSAPRSSTTAIACTRRSRSRFPELSLIPMMFS